LAKVRSRAPGWFKTAAERFRALQVIVQALFAPARRKFIKNSQSAYGVLIGHWQDTPAEQEPGPANQRLSPQVRPRFRPGPREANAVGRCKQILFDPHGSASFSN
jgi:hypothetical protein